MATAYEKLVSHFADRELRYTAHDERQTVTADFRGDVGAFRLMARIDDDDSLLQVFAYIPIRATPGSRAAIAEAVSRANFGMKVGKFELDMSDGELLYQSAQILVPDGEGETFLPDHVIGRLVGTALAMVDKYTPAYLSIIYGNETPEDAVRCVESPPASSLDESLRGLLGGASSPSTDSQDDDESPSKGDASGQGEGAGDASGRKPRNWDACPGDASPGDASASGADDLDGDDLDGDDLADGSGLDGEDSDDASEAIGGGSGSAGSDTFEPLREWTPERDREES
jgi:hypothetical protein